ncbi:Uma2 family endonuclease, partial [Desulfobacterales bacterium HSG16]|nr:Uma2 family endonuclease [Desulfobacterales bacterium HSG16]
MSRRAGSYTSEKEYPKKRTSNAKREYFDGEIFAMAKASRRHNLIVANVIISLGSQLKNKPCCVYPSDMMLKIEKTGLNTCPDVMVVCNEEKFTNEKQQTLLNPDVIIEVLSDSTEQYDRGEKFKQYRQLESLREYIIISKN